jgi:hypothetical protein
VVGSGSQSVTSYVFDPNTLISRGMKSMSSCMGAPWHGPSGPWPTKKFGRVGRNVFSPPTLFTLLLCQNKERSG